MNKRQRYSKKQMYSLISKWEASGLTQSKFCEEHQITKSTFGYWRKKYLQDQRQSATKRMIPVHILPPQQAQPAAEVQNIEIVYPNGVRIICPLAMESSRVKALIL